MNRLATSVAATVAVLWSTTGSPAFPGQSCGPRDVLTAALAEVYQERIDWIGLTGVGTLMELYVSKRGTWTIIVSMADGTSCIVASGEYWDRPKPPFTEV